MRQSQSKNKIYGIVFFFAVFVAMFVFFAYIHPLYLFDADDWTNISEHRVGIPVWGWWNPAKVLPEVMFPLAGDLGVWVIRLFVKDYVLSIMLSTTLVLAAVITLYVHEVSAVLDFCLEIRGGLNYLLSFFFLLLHFLILKTGPENNPYLFYVPNISSAYHYIIPALLAASLVMYLMRTDIRKLTHLQMAFLFLATYLCIFSNLFQSVILASYASFIVLKELLAAVKKTDRQHEKKFCLIKFLKEECYYLLILLMFLAACVFELSGGRAGDTKSQLHVGDSVNTFLAWPGKMNLLFRLMALGLAAALIGYKIYRRMTRKAGEIKSGDEDEGKAEVMYNDLAVRGIYCFITTSLFLILLCSVLSVFYIGSSDVFLSAAFYLLFFLILTAGYLLKKMPVLIYTVPLICFVSLTFVTNGLRIFMDPRAVRPEECLAMSRDFVRQVVEADRAGLDAVALKVPDYGSEDNWPQPLYFGYRLANTLYRHGMTDKLMDVTTQPTEGYEPKETLDVSAENSDKP